MKKTLRNANENNAGKGATQNASKLIKPGSLKLNQRRFLKPRQKCLNQDRVLKNISKPY